MKSSPLAALSAALALALSIMGLGSPANATTIPQVPVYSGCDAPTAQFSPTSGHIYYLDPVHGSMSGDGTAVHPWGSLQAVFAANMFANAPANAYARKPANPTAPIHPGDTLVLMSGDHGSILLQGTYGTTQEGFYNNRFINIVAAPGAKPVLDQLTVKGASHWVFYGLTIRNVQPNLKGGMYGYIVSLEGPHDNIVLANNNIETVGANQNWSTVDWRTNVVSGIIDSGGSCISMSNNHFTNVGFGMSTQRSTNVQIDGNSIDYFTDDGIDYGSSNLLIQNNQIRNSIEDGDGMHRDGMQGQPYSATTVVSNVLIQNNRIIRETDPAVRYPGYLQGIDTFDGVWQNVTVRNNIVVTDAYQGIAYYGVTGLNVQGNILLNDSGRVLSCLTLTATQCDAAQVTYDLSSTPGITVHKSKTGVSSDSAVIEDNIADVIDPAPDTTNITVRNNMLVLPYQGKNSILELTTNGKTVWAGKPGTYGDNNVITGVGADKVFRVYDPANLQYDFNFQPGYSQP